MASTPLLFRWSGSAMEPLPRFAKECDRRYVIGEAYALEERHDRSSASHAFYFARLAEIWQSLPDDQAERFPSAESLRKFCLIKAGYCNQQQIVCASKAEARRMPALFGTLDEYALVSVRDAVVTIFTAQSQSYRAMGKEAFNASKEAVLEIAAGLIGVTADDARRAAA